MGRLKRERRREMFMENECSVCGKIFIPSSLHVYKDRRNKRKNVCSWNCVCRSERLKKAAEELKTKKR